MEPRYHVVFRQELGSLYRRLCQARGSTIHDKVFFVFTTQGKLAPGALKCLLAKKGKGKNNQNIATPDFRKEIDITPFSLSKKL